MRDNSRKVIVMQWIVIGTLLVGAGVGGFLMMGKVNDLNDTNSTLTSDNLSLRNQLRELRDAATPSPSPTPAATPTPAPSPSPAASPTATPKPTVTPRR